MDSPRLTASEAGRLTATDALFAKAFSKRLLIPAKDAAGLLGVDENTLRGMADSGAIRCVRLASGVRRYAEADLRAFLEGGGCPSTRRLSR